MANIVKIRKGTWTQPDYSRGWQYDVYYESGRRVRYNWQECLPKTVVEFLISNDIKCETEYRDHGGLPVKWETFTRI